jgi:flagellar biogenesis protein FliO
MESSEKVRPRQVLSGSNEVQPMFGVESDGLAGWVLRLLGVWRSQRLTASRQLRLVETLPLGGKRQVMLVMCDGERFLVGGGSDSVQTIVRVSADGPFDAPTNSLDEI